jgi:hypothetical protein
MEVEAKTEFKAVLTLTKTECEWLRAVMQNQFWPEEDAFTNQKRAELFEKLNNALNRGY